MNYQPFKVTCKLLDGRVCSSDGLFFLDSILYRALIARDVPELIYGEPLYEGHSLKLELPVERTQQSKRAYKYGLYKASCGFYYLYNIKTDSWSKLSGNFMDYDKIHLIRKDFIVNTSSGVFKSYLSQILVRLVGDIEFYGVGDIDEVRDILSYMPAIGKKTDIGYGQVKEWIVEPCDEDYSLIGPYGLMRPLKVGSRHESEIDDIQKYQIRTCGVYPPYHKTCNQKVCYIPEVAINKKEIHR